MTGYLLQLLVAAGIGGLLGDLYTRYIAHEVNGAKYSYTRFFVGFLTIFALGVLLNRIDDPFGDYWLAVAGKICAALVSLVATFKILRRARGF